MLQYRGRRWSRLYWLWVCVALSGTGCGGGSSGASGNTSSISPAAPTPSSTSPSSPAPVPPAPNPSAPQPPASAPRPSPPSPDQQTAQAKTELSLLPVYTELALSKYVAYSRQVPRSVFLKSTDRFLIGQASGEGYVTGDEANAQPCTLGLSDRGVLSVRVGDEIRTTSLNSTTQVQQEYKRDPPALYLIDPADSGISYGITAMSYGDPRMTLQVSASVHGLVCNSSLISASTPKASQFKNCPTVTADGAANEAAIDCFGGSYTGSVVAADEAQYLGQSCRLDIDHLETRFFITGWPADQMAPRFWYGNHWGQFSNAAAQSGLNIDVSLSAWAQLSDHMSHGLSFSVQGNGAELGQPPMARIQYDRSDNDTGSLSRVTCEGRQAI